MMKSTKRLRFILLSGVIACAAISAVAFGAYQSFYTQVGEGFGAVAGMEDGDQVVATYQGKEVTLEMVRKQHLSDQYGDDTSAASGAALEQENLSEAEEQAALDALITKQIILTWAEEDGLAATQEEIDEYISFLKANYEEVPEVAQIVDDYRAGAGLTLEEYWAEVEGNSYQSITIQKYKNAFTEQYCQEMGYTEDPRFSLEVHDAVEAAYEAHCQEAFEACQGDVTYAEN